MVEHLIVSKHVYVDW